MFGLRSCRRPNAILHQHLRDLSLAYPLSIADDYCYVIVSHFLLPPGFNCRRTEVLIELPDGYPISPPGVGDSHVYMRPHLRYHNRLLDDLHTSITPGWGDWAWLCYQWISWDAHNDNLITFLEMVRADLTDPPTA
jgi:hypothetical protein